MYSPLLFAVRCDLEQSAGGSHQLPLPPPGLSLRERKKEGKKERLSTRERKRERRNSHRSDSDPTDQGKNEPSITNFE